MDCAVSLFCPVITLTTALQLLLSAAISEIILLCCCSKKAIADIRGSGRICILDIDMQGVKSIKQTDIKCRYIFVKPPSIKHLVILFSLLINVIDLRYSKCLGLHHDS